MEGSGETMELPRNWSVMEEEEGAPRCDLLAAVTPQSLMSRLPLMTLMLWLNEAVPSKWMPGEMGNSAR